MIHGIGIKTIAGTFRARFTNAGLARLEFPGANGRTAMGKKEPLPPQVRRWREQTRVALQLVLSGQEARDLPPLDLSDGTEFQRSVWAALGRIEAGKTRSYSQIASAIGRPGAVRAVGNACGANPIPVLIPCHRVLAAGGRLGGFSGGLDWKRRLLAREGHRPLPLWSS